MQGTVYRVSPRNEFEEVSGTFQSFGGGDQSSNGLFTARLSSLLPPLPGHLPQVGGLYFADVVMVNPFLYIIYRQSKREREREKIGLFLNCFFCYALRDVKMDNVLMCGGLVKLGDFGLASPLPGPGGTLTNQCGSPHYMCPQIVTAQPYTTKADVWSLGVLIFRLLSGNMPFQAENFKELNKRIVQRDYEVPGQKILFSKLQIYFL